MSKDKEKETTANQNSIRYQVAVLKALSSTINIKANPTKQTTEKPVLGKKSTSHDLSSKTVKKPVFVSKAMKIDEIAEVSGIFDEKETQRYLFILEGQRLVSPFPEGDLTSRNWGITQTGMNTVEQLNKVGG